MSNISETSEATSDEEIARDYCSASRQKRFTEKQVMLLEKSFELDHKLATDRKLCLAQKLNLQPRQVVVWFQNRRTRWKTKELERSYKALRKQYDVVKSEYEALMQEKDMLQNKVLQLKERLQTRSDQILQKEISTPETSVAEAVQKADQKDGLGFNTDFEYQFGSEQLKINQEMCFFDAEVTFNMIFANQMLNISLDPHAGAELVEETIFSTPLY